ncbi:MAG: ATP--guanido phosphotransferase [Lachnospiraceae bacterium]|nr:ATP--guanido phosphotransferase [Lachnospiraceae bacterium]
MLKWYEKTEGQHDVFVAQRIRLVRNIEHCNFPEKMSAQESRDLLEKMKQEFSDIRSVSDIEYDYYDIDSMDARSKSMLYERRIINKALMEKSEPAGILLAQDEASGIVMNGDDHIKLFEHSCSEALDELWAKADVLDDYINSHFSYAYSEKYGYLTAFPTNVGTGMKASVIMHLPLLSGSRQFKTLFNEMGRFGITLKNVYAENGENFGSLYEISNQKTLGQTEEDIVEVVTKMANQLADSERKLRSVALRNHRVNIEDEVYKSYGVLKYARKLTVKEAMTYLSHVRKGVLDGLISTEKPVNIFGIMMEIQSANLLGSHNSESEEPDALRAEYVRKHLPNLI